MSEWDYAPDKGDCQIARNEAVHPAYLISTNIVFVLGIRGDQQ
jgi:hypothetical protein